MPRSRGIMAAAWVPINERTSDADGDPIAGPPWHNHEPVHIRRLDTFLEAA